MDEQLLPVMDKEGINILKCRNLLNASQSSQHPILIPSLFIHNKKYLGNTGQDLKPGCLLSYISCKSSKTFLPQKRRVLNVFIHSQVHQVLSCLQKKKLWVMGCFTSLKYFLFSTFISVETTLYKYYIVVGG